MKLIIILTCFTMTYSSMLKTLDDKYEGQRNEKGQKHGYGIMIYGEKQEKYIGEWKNDMREGYGVLIDMTINNEDYIKFEKSILVDGKPYELNYKYRHFEIMMSNIKTNYIYYGTWKNDKYDGVFGIKKDFTNKQYLMTYSRYPLFSKPGERYSEDNPHFYYCGAFYNGYYDTHYYNTFGASGLFIDIKSSNIVNAKQLIIYDKVTNVPRIRTKNDYYSTLEMIRFDCCSLHTLTADRHGDFRISIKSDNVEMAIFNTKMVVDTFKKDSEIQEIKNKYQKQLLNFKNDLKNEFNLEIQKMKNEFSKKDLEIKNLKNDIIDISEQCQYRSDNIEKIIAKIRKIIMTKVAKIEHVLTILFVVIFVKLSIHTCVLVMGCYVERKRRLRQRNNGPPGGPAIDN